MNELIDIHIYICKSYLLWFLFWPWGWIKTYEMPFLGDKQLFESYFGSHPVTSVSANKYPHQHIKDVIRYYRSSYIHTYIRAYIHTYVHTYHTIPYHYHYHSHSHSHYITLHTYIHIYIETYIDIYAYTYIDTQKIRSFWCR